jgi:hypothetical protein
MAGQRIAAQVDPTGITCVASAAHSIDRKQSWMPLRGALEFTIDGETTLVTARDALAVPSGATRQFCIDWATLCTMSGRTYAENRPYLLPDALGELTGPVTGAVQLPLRLDWSERAVFHLDDPAERNVMYERVIREATQADDLRSYLNEAVLRRV